ncbi:MAG: hypothetical protein ABI579_04580 [Candidatus Sumerlaeota bacterium]
MIKKILKFAFVILFFGFALWFGLSHIYSAFSNDGIKLEPIKSKALTARPVAQVNEWDSRLRSASGITIENNASFVSIINKSSIVELIPNDGTYTPPSDLLSVCNGLPGHIVVALGCNDFKEFNGFLKENNVSSEPPFEKIVSVYRLASPSCDWRKIEPEKTVIKVFELSNTRVSDDLKSKAIFDTYRKTGLEAHVSEITFSITARDGTPNRASLYLVDTGGHILLLNSFAFANFRMIKSN